LEEAAQTLSQEVEHVYRRVRKPTDSCRALGCDGREEQREPQSTEAESTTGNSPTDPRQVREQDPKYEDIASNNDRLQGAPILVEHIRDHLGYPRREDQPETRACGGHAPQRPLLPVLVG
jgi:hypothetical protein